MLNTSRWLNAVGSAAVMRRAYLEAAAFAREREAFGRPIVEFPLVRESLAVMRAEAEAALASIARGDAARRLGRCRTTSRTTASSSTRTSSPRPRPRRVRSVAGSKCWEGTARSRTSRCCRGCGATRSSSRAGKGRTTSSARRWRETSSASGRSSSCSPARGASIRASTPLSTPCANGWARLDPLHFRRQLDTLVRAVQAATLVRSGAPTAELHIRRHLVPGYDPERDPEYLDLG